ncbi:DUF3883 domain-containing protein [Pseudomonas syringae]|uniref:DUF3883 domain-containing protein n=1 Tax=Pseudomonas TaxID=286 RepID=UPI00076084C8|nr:DUF3883 domain-containing protein [Pseudomonas syringae]KWS20187.1 hypothetical protein AL062_21410 [Pseudomonas syringae pv. syringae]
MDAPIVFVNIGWMVSYQGPDNDPTIGGHGWLKTHAYGHEAWNFQPARKKLYGYIPRSARINLRRLGAAKNNDKVEGVTVIWVARNPRDQVTYVVGWYRSAVVYLESGHFEIKRSSGDVVGYQIEAPSAGATLLAPDQRVLKVPTAKVKGNLGQSPVWYGNPEFVAKVRSYLDASGNLSKVASKKQVSSPRQLDPEMRKLVELAAVRHAIKYYESTQGGSRVVKSVEKDNVGWDLTVSSNDVDLKVEVKGLSGSDLCAELTPNEYKQMLTAEHRRSYVIYIVTNALGSSARSHVFYHNSELSTGGKHCWLTEDGRVLKIKELTAARLTID